MSDNIILEQLRHIRSTQSAHTSQFSEISAQLRALQADAIARHVDTGRVDEQLAIMQARLDLIERRLQISD